MLLSHVYGRAAACRRDIPNRLTDHEAEKIAGSSPACPSWVEMVGWRGTTTRPAAGASPSRPIQACHHRRSGTESCWRSTVLAARRKGISTSSRGPVPAQAHAVPERWPGIWSARGPAPGTVGTYNPIWARPDARVEGVVAYRIHRQKALEIHMSSTWSFGT